MRIDKYLANMNVGSRKEAHVLIKKGIVTVNGDVVKTPKQQVRNPMKYWQMAKRSTIKSIITS